VKPSRDVTPDDLLKILKATGGCIGNPASEKPQPYSELEQSVFRERAYDAGYKLYDLRFERSQVVSVVFDLIKNGLVDLEGSWVILTEKGYKAATVTGNQTEESSQ
jgi:hypothetical protein